MKMLRNILVVVSLVVAFTSSAFAADILEKDTLRLETSGDWVILSDADSSYTIGVWAWADDNNVLGASIPLRLIMSGDDYSAVKHDSFVVVDTIFKDGAWNPAIFTFRRSVVKNDVGYTSTDDDLGFNGVLFGGVNIFAPPLLNLAAPTKLGEMVLKIRHPEMLPNEFTIEIDSAFHPPAGTFKYTPTGSQGHQPYFDKVTILVNNSVLDAGDVLKEIKPESYRLNQNTPNPFNPSTTISFYNEAKGHVNLAIYNLLGQKVKTLIDWEMAPGQQDVLWDGTDNNSENVSSGIYFYRLTAGEFHDIKKMMLLK